MKKSFGTLPSGEETYLYTISCGGITASVSDYGASLVSLFVPDRNGHISDVVMPQEMHVWELPWAATPIAPVVLHLI